MADCCTPGTGFPNSALMDQLSLNHSVVWEEICKLQQAILAAASQCQSGGGQFCTIVAGDTPMTFIAGITGVTVVSGGSGYYQDSPSVEFIPPYGATGASGAVGTVVTNGGKVLSINITSPGTGYQPLSSTMSVSTLTGSAAQLKPLVNASGQIVSVAVLNPGSGYTLTDTVTATRAVAPNAAYTNATFKISTIGTNGEIVAVTILNPGSGYEDAVTTVRLVSTLNPSEAYPLGAGFAGTVLTDNTTGVSGVLINNGGVGYAVYPPYLVITNPGYGAITKVNLTGTSVSSIDVLSTGSNYTPTPTGIVYNPTTAGSPNPPATPATVTVQFGENTYGTDPNKYYQVFVGSMTNKQLAMQMNTVISYFKGLGYTITRQTNPETGTTLQWKICW